MKKILAFTLCFALLLTALFVPMTAVAETNLIATDAVADWDAHLTVAEKGQYIRPKALDDGTIGAAWYVMGDGGHFGISYDGGVTYKNDVTVVKNEWSTTEEERDQGIYKYGRREVQNPNVIQMADGRLLYTYRFNTFTSQPEGEKTWDTYYSSIRYQISDDGGASWGEPVVIKEFEIDDPDKEQGQAGYWEPEPYYIGEDLYVYWCDTVTNEPNFGVQNVLGAKWNGNGFDESFIAIDGTLTSSRDGMCVVTTLADGSYAMVYESTDTDGNPDTHNIHDLSCLYCENDKITFVIKMARSKDGVNWNEEDAVIIAKPEILKSHVDAEGGAENVCASPYVITLPDGRLAISYQTTDLYNGDVIPTTVVRRSVVQVAISDIAVGYDTAISTANFKKIDKSPANVVDNQYANAGSLLYNNGKLLAYCYIGTNSVKEDGSVSSTNSQGIKMAYIDISLEETLDANDRENYIVYHNGGKDVTVNDDGSFSFVAGTTNMLYGEEYRAAEPAEFDVDISYDAADYTTKGQSGYGFSADSTAQTISFTASKQAKAQFDYVADAKMFDIDVTMQGNSGGTIWGGVAFHTQESDFASAVFNTAGYSVYLVRSSSALNKLTLYVRYCTEGGVNANTYQPVLTTGLPTDKDLKLRLQVSVGEETFTIKALNEDGSVQYGETKTYNLDDTAAQSQTKYYETGKINLITNGIHTFSNISITRTTQEVDISYNANNYTTNGQSGYAFSADAENKTLSFTASKQAKAMLNYVKSADIPDIDVTMQGNTGGTIWGGVAFHVQESDFASAAFNTAGYSVYLVRSSSALNKLTLYVRYCTEGGVNANTYQPVLTTELPTDIDLKLRLQVSVGETSFEVKALSEDGKTQYGETKTYNLDDTAAQSKTKYYETGKIGLIVNGIHTFSNISITNKTPIVKYGNIEKTADLDAHAVIDFPASVDEDNQVGLSFRVQQAADTSPGLTGYVIKLLQTTEETNEIKIQMTRYGTNSAGEINKNLGNMYTYTDTTVLGGGKIVGSAIILDAKLRDNIISLTLTNADDATLTSTYEFDLKTASGNYEDYYAEGGFGFFKNGNATEINISDIEFTKVAKNVNNITDNSIYTVYRPEVSEEVTFADNAFINNDASTKKIMLNNTLVSDFKADTTLEVGYDGNLKGGIIFRAQNIGNETNDMDGYSAVVFKTPNTTTNYGRIVLLVYKWARLADGTMDYMGTLGSKVFLDTLNSVYPEAETDILAAAGVKIKLNLEVVGDTVTTSFDVLNESNIVAASTEDLVVDLNATPTGMDKTKVFAEDSYSVLYNAGEIGLSISTLGKICDFNLEADTFGINDTDVSDYVVYSSNTNTMVIDSVNDKITSTTTGHKQAVLSGRNTNEFDVTATLKSTSAGATYNMSFDFAIDESSHSGTCAAGSATAYMFEGYRVQLTRVNSSTGDNSHANLRLYKFEKVDNGDGTYSNKRTELENVANADFFADYDEVGYGNVEVVLSVKLVDGVLYADAYVKDYPNRTLSYTYNEGMDTAEGTIGWYVEGGGSVTMNNIQLGFEGQMITAADCENGSVYAAINSGAAAVGDTVKIAYVANEGYRIDTAFANGNEVAETEDGFTFVKEFGKTEISATFFLVGDIAKDGKVDSTDIASLRKNIIGAEEIAEKYADINDDGAVDVIDLVRIKKISAGIK